MKEQRDIGELSKDEITDVETHLIRLLQPDHFAEEYKCLYKQEIQSNRKILSLPPRIDENGLLRSSRQFENEDHLDYDAKYPVIFPKGNWVAKMIVRN